MVSADAFWSRGQDHEPHGCRATRRDAHRLLRRALDLALAREILHADNVIARWNVAGREDADVALDRAGDPSGLDDTPNAMVSTPGPRLVIPTVTVPGGG